MLTLDIMGKLLFALLTYPFCLQTGRVLWCLYTRQLVHRSGDRFSRTKMGDDSRSIADNDLRDWILQFEPVLLFHYQRLVRIWSRT